MHQAPCIHPLIQQYGKAKTKNMCGSSNPTDPNFFTPTLKLSLKNHVLLFVFILKDIRLLSFANTIIRLQLSQEDEDNVQYIKLYRFNTYFKT